jgi:surface antigen
MYYGNAKDWVYAASNRGIPVYREPKPGDVAISTAGAWGHAMYVEAVSGDVMLISQYNVNLDGRYSTAWRKWR